MHVGGTPLRNRPLYIYTISHKPISLEQKPIVIKRKGVIHLAIMTHSRVGSIFCVFKLDE